MLRAPTKGRKRGEGCACGGMRSTAMDLKPELRKRGLTGVTDGMVADQRLEVAAAQKKYGAAGGIRSENADMSNDNASEKLARR